MTSAQIFGPNFEKAEVWFFKDSHCRDVITDATEVGDNEASLCLELRFQANSFKYISSI